jgi:hypothetical protein
MAKRHKVNLITGSFHYLVKTLPNEKNPKEPLEAPFSQAEFDRIIARISNVTPLNVKDPAVVDSIKAGYDMPFLSHEEIDTGLYFGEFEGAYYGQEYRNNLLGRISADSLNLRQFHYLLTRLRDGKILVGVSYNGQFGDYEGIRRCFLHLLRSTSYQIKSKTITSLVDEIGDGVATEIRLNYRKANSRPEKRSIFGDSGVIAIKASEYGDEFGEKIGELAKNVRGDVKARKRALAAIVNQGDLIELADDDIVGCSAIVRENGRQTTVYFVGGSNMATKFRLNVEVDVNGRPNRNHVRQAMIEVMRNKVIPLLG